MVEIIRTIAEMVWQIIQRVMNKEYLKGKTTIMKGAEKREESVLLQFSVDGGITWKLLEELHHLENRIAT